MFTALLVSFSNVLQPPIQPLSAYYHNLCHFFPSLKVIHKLLNHQQLLLRWQHSARITATHGHRAAYTNLLQWSLPWQTCITRRQYTLAVGHAFSYVHGAGLVLDLRVVVEVTAAEARFWPDHRVLRSQRRVREKLDELGQLVCFADVSSEPWHR